MATALRIDKAERSSQKRSQTDIALKNRRERMWDLSQDVQRRRLLADDGLNAHHPSRFARASLLLPCAQQ